MSKVSTSSVRIGCAADDVGMLSGSRRLWAQVQLRQLLILGRPVDCLALSRKMRCALFYHCSCRRSWQKLLKPGEGVA